MSARFCVLVIKTPDKYSNNQNKLRPVKKYTDLCVETKIRRFWRYENSLNRIKNEPNLLSHKEHS